MATIMVLVSNILDNYRQTSDEMVSYEIQDSGDVNEIDMGRNGIAIMGDHIASQGMSRLTDLKKGDKFYENDWDDNEVYELVDLAIVHEEDDEIHYFVRKLGSKHEIRKTIRGQGVVNRHIVCKYKGRDRGSFLAGFRAAMSIYQKHMQVFDKENAGLNNPFEVWRTMTEKYDNWKKV